MTFRFELAELAITLNRHVSLLDTNVLVTLCHPHTEKRARENVEEFLSLYRDEGDLFVTQPVLVETWGMLSKKARTNQKVTHESKLGMIQRLIDEGIRFLPSDGRNEDGREALGQVRDLMYNKEIDYVDAHLIICSEALHEAAAGNSSLQIVTADTRDFTRCGDVSFRYRVFDIINFETMDFSQKER